MPVGPGNDGRTRSPPLPSATGANMLEETKNIQQIGNDPKPLKGQSYSLETIITLQRLHEHGIPEEAAGSELPDNPRRKDSPAMPSNEAPSPTSISLNELDTDANDLVSSVVRRLRSLWKLLSGTSDCKRSAQRAV